ncbi:hypothetical protein M9H77_23929 [Catharanthus roseus]|uniref:Uncharacterized protein n=1 Tax=Catharanthus roseus TaxID=4058 RepID=A0ACC0AYT0_CATRO|nr:hypothetical protein M9H77_23929 [Catharanthus roseus]
MRLCESNTSIVMLVRTKISPKGVVDRQQVNILVLPFIGSEGQRRLGYPKDGYRFKNVMCACFFKGHKGLYEILTTSWHAPLSLNLAMLGSLTIVVAHHVYSMPPYPYLATDYGTQLSLFTHHIWIGRFLIVGFHSFGLYIHNDTMSTLGRPQDMFSDTAIQLQPIFAQWIQNTHAFAPSATAPGATASTSLTWGGGDLVAVGGKVALLPIQLGTADFSVHHIHAFTIHVTVLILLNGVLLAHNSRLMPDKANLGFCVPCDGPGRGGGRGYWQELIESIVWDHNKLKVAPATQPRALSIVQGRAEDLKGIMALRFPRFSQGLAQDPSTRRIWFGIATVHFRLSFLPIILEVLLKYKEMIQFQS